MNAYSISFYQALVSHLKILQEFDRIILPNYTCYEVEDGTNRSVESMDLQSLNLFFG